MRALLFTALGVWSLCGAPREARASEWYGWQTLSVDAGSIGTGLAIGALSKRGDLGLVTWGAGYLAGSPVVHAAHAHPDAILPSLGLRTGLPVAFFLAGVLTASATTRPRGAMSGLAALAMGILGAAIGGGAAIAIDAILLARKTDREAPPLSLVRFGGAF